MIDLNLVVWYGSLNIGYDSYLPLREIILFVQNRVRGVFRSVMTSLIFPSWRAAENHDLLNDRVPAVLQPEPTVISTDPPTGGEWRDLPVLSLNQTTETWLKKKSHNENLINRRTVWNHLMD